MVFKAVVFDLGNVICPFSHHAICNQLAEFSPLNATGIYQQVFTSGLEAKFDEGRLTPQHFYRDVCRAINARISLSEFQQAWVNIFSLDREVVEIYHRLKKVKRCLLSNTNEWHFEHLLHSFPVLRHFDGYALSYRLGVKKPDSAIYQHILEISGLNAEECVYIDDIAEYVRKAEELGFKGIHFRGAAALRQELSKLTA